MTDQPRVPGETRPARERVLEVIEQHNQEHPDRQFRLVGNAIRKVARHRQVAANDQSR